MTTVGFSFTKISAERKNVSEPNIRIENNVGITNVEEANVIDPKKSLVRFEFLFKCKYEPNLGNVDLTGELIEIYDKDLASSIVDGWKNDKKISPEIMHNIMNNILNRANIEAIVISREVGLPSPISLPKVEVKPKEAKPSEIRKEEAKQEVKKEDKSKKK